MFETLSRYLAGELDEAEAADVRARIDADPEWKAAWVAVQSLPDTLGALPHPAPPPALDARVLATWEALGTPVVAAPAPAEAAPEPVVAAPSPRRTPAWAWAAPLALAAGVLGAVSTWQAPPELQLRLGTQRVDGEVHLLAGDTRIDVDGVVDVTVEPGDVHFARAEAGMDRSHLVAAAAGSVVTLAVVEGVAFVRGDADEVVTVKAGERTVIGADGTASRPAATAPLPADAQARIAALESELDDLKLRYAMVKGQLDLRLGASLEFPPDLPPGFRPGDFEPRARAVADAVAATELVRTECDEYPCVAYYRSETGDPSWTATLGKALSTEYGEKAGIFQMGLRVEEGDRVAAIAAVAVIPSNDAELAEMVRARLTPRVEPTMNELESDERGK